MLGAGGARQPPMIPGAPGTIRPGKSPHTVSGRSQAARRGDTDNRESCPGIIQSAGAGEIAHDLSAIRLAIHRVRLRSDQEATPILAQPGGAPAKRALQSINARVIPCGPADRGMPPESRSINPRARTTPAINLPPPPSISSWVIMKISRRGRLAATKITAAITSFNLTLSYVCVARGSPGHADRIVVPVPFIWFASRHPGEPIIHAERQFVQMRFLQQ
jgi:hypothetical protein